MRVLITGAAGNIGRKLVDHLRRQGGRFAVLGLDVAAARPYADQSHDLSVWDPAWVDAFRGADAVVHLAALPSPQAEWSEVVPHNVDLLLNVYEAARLHGVGRIVLASSNWILGGYRFEEGTRLTPDTAPRPLGAYGAAKLFAERLGKQLSERTGTSVVNLRLGTNPPDGSRPEGPPSTWERMLSLSDGDLCQAFEKALTVPDVHYATLIVTSRVIDSPWDLTETERVLGYVPADEFRVDRSPTPRARSAMAWLRARRGPRGTAR